MKYYIKFIMYHTLTVRGAYSTDFKNKGQILEHYNQNKDFSNIGISSGAYVNKKDAKRFKVGFLNVRYKNDQKVAVINVLNDSIK